MAEPGGPREQRVPADHDDRPIQDLNQDELLDLLSRRTDAGEPYGDVEKALDRHRAALVAPVRITDEAVLDSIDTSGLEKRPIADVRAGLPDEAEECRRLGREILDAKAAVASVVSELSERIRHLRDEKIRNEHMEDVRKIAEKVAGTLMRFNAQGADKLSVQDLDLLLGECNDVLRRLHDIRIIIDDLSVFEE